jgi:lipopolysaccharide export system protein LptC
MKSGSGQIFAIFLLALLAGLSFWLKKAVEPPSDAPSAKTRHEPDAIAENFTIRQYDAAGRVARRLSAPYMEHFPDDDSSELKSPKLVRHKLDTPDMTLTGDRARVTSKGETVLLEDNVIATRAATAERQQLVARMPDLTVKPNDGVAYTASPVEITEGPSWMKGIGMHIDNDTSTFKLQSEVTGLLYPRRAAK